MKARPWTHLDTSPIHRDWRAIVLLTHLTPGKGCKNMLRDHMRHAGTYRVLPPTALPHCSGLGSMPRCRDIWRDQRSGAGWSRDNRRRPHRSWGLTGPSAQARQPPRGTPQRFPKFAEIEEEYARQDERVSEVLQRPLEDRELEKDRCLSVPQPPPHAIAP